MKVNIISNILDVNQTLQTNTAVNGLVFQGRDTLIIQQMFTLLMQMLFFCTCLLFISMFPYYMNIAWRHIKSFLIKNLITESYLNAAVMTIASHQR